MKPGQTPLLQKHENPTTSLRLRIVLLLFSLFVINPLCAQSAYTPSAITVEDGLGFRAVTAIAQDTKGFLWVGTDKGLNYYDGYRFLHFNKEESADHYFPADDVMDYGLQLFNDSTLWIVADEKLYALNLKTYESEQVREIPGDIYGFQPGNKQDYWFMVVTNSEQQIWHYQPLIGFREVTAIPKPQREFTSLQVDTSGNIWWSNMTEGLMCFDESGKLLHQKRVDTYQWFGSTIHHVYLHIDSRNRIFVFPRSRNEVWQYFPAQDSIVVIADKLPSMIYCAYEDHQGNNWFATREELVQLDTRDNVRMFSSSLKRVMEYYGITAFFQDQADVLWIGTDGGLLRIPQTQSFFDNYFVNDQLGRGNALRDITEGRPGELFFYCELGNWGLWHVNLKNEAVTRVNFEADSIYVKETLDQAKHFIYDEKRTCLWAFTTQLLQINVADKPSIHIVENKEKYVYPAGPKVLYRLSNGNLLLAEKLNNMMIYQPDQDTWRILGSQWPEELSETVVQCITDDGKTLWVGTRDQGVLQLNLKGEILAHYHTASSPALGNNNILSLQLDSAAKRLSLGTFGGGLHILKLAHREIEIYNQKDGLSDDNIVSIIPYKEKLWLATYNGLSVFDFAQKSFRNFYAEDGLSNNEFNYSSEAVGSDGTIYLGGLNGINAFHPDSLLQNQFSLPLQLVSFQKFDHQQDSLLEYHLPIHSLDTPLVISSSISYFRFDWSLPDYVKPEKNQYFIKMDGIDKDWVFHGSQPFIRFNSLAAGNYRLHIKGRDNQGNWSATELSIPIRVLAPVYQRWWFISMAILALLGLVSTITRYRYKQQLAMEKIRTRIASDLHDEVGSMLSGLAMQAEIIELQPEEATADNFAYMKEISRQAVSKMRDLVWSIDSRRDNMHHLLDRMQEHATEVLGLRNIDFQLKSTDLPLQQKLAVDERQNLYLIFREALTNCCKHSNADSVDIFFGRRKGKLELRIHDNGTQNGKGVQSTGLGMDNMHTRAKALKGKLTIDNSDGFLVLFSSVRL